jgi:hypothetical protein
MKESAADHFKSRRGGCAQSVALAWRDKKDPASTHAERFAALGSGRAPDGLCGALYAARELAGDHKEKLTEQFKENAGGHTTCRGIRKNRIMPCTDCVSLAAGLLDELQKETTS